MTALLGAVTVHADDGDDVAVRVEGVSKKFRLYQERNQSLKAAMMRGGRATYDEFWALKQVSFEIPRGGTFGLIGQTTRRCFASAITSSQVVGGWSIKSGRYAATSVAASIASAH